VTRNLECREELFWLKATRKVTDILKNINFYIHKLCVEHLVNSFIYKLFLQNFYFKN
jgi:hypothetical protein